MSNIMSFLKILSVISVLLNKVQYRVGQQSGQVTHYKDLQWRRWQITLLIEVSTESMHFESKNQLNQTNICLDFLFII